MWLELNRLVRQRLPATGTTILRSARPGASHELICERLVGALRRELLDRVLILGERHLRAVLTDCQAHYNTTRPHQGVAQHVPDHEHDAHRCHRYRHRYTTDPPKTVLGGLINKYRHAA